MKITDMHVTRIELTADEVNHASALYADHVFHSGENQQPARAVPQAFDLPHSLKSWESRTETVRAPDGGAVVTITRTR